MDRKHKRPERVKMDLGIDIAIFSGFLIATVPRFTGLLIHEWLGIAFAATIVAHLVRHWSWIMTVTRRFLGFISWRARINYILNVLLFINGTLLIFTGLMISKMALPLLGLRFPHDRLWLWLHQQTADMAVVLIGLHIALHWPWIRHTLQRHVIQPLMHRHNISVPHQMEQYSTQEVK